MKEKENTIITSILKNSSPKKWKKYLDDYHNYTKEYIKHHQKSLQGDTASLSIYPYMKSRSEALHEQLFDAKQKSLLTKKQIKRMSEIQIQIKNHNLI